MKASLFDRVGAITHRVNVGYVGKYGEATGQFAPARNVRLQLVDRSTSGRSGSGDSLEDLLTLRMRFTYNLGPGDILTFEGHSFEVTSVQELGRRAFLEIKAARVSRPSDGCHIEGN